MEHLHTSLQIAEERGFGRHTLSLNHYLWAGMAFCQRAPNQGGKPAPGSDFLSAAASIADLQPVDIEEDTILSSFFQV